MFKVGSQTASTPSTQAGSTCVESGHRHEVHVHVPGQRQKVLVYLGAGLASPLRLVPSSPPADSAGFQWLTYVCLNR